MMIPAGGETSAKRERRLMKDAMRAAGSSLFVSPKLATSRGELTGRRGKCREDGRIWLDT
jgi:hypothetical protein